MPVSSALYQTCESPASDPHVADLVMDTGALAANLDRFLER